MAKRGVTWDRGNMERPCDCSPLAGMVLRGGKSDGNPLPAVAVRAENVHVRLALGLFEGMVQIG